MSGAENTALPNSVVAYLTDAATRAAVDALLAVDAESLPPEIEWKELSDYYAARAVAELTRAEFALALHTLWREIWGPAIPTGWAMPEPQELVEEGQGVSLGSIWEGKSFSLFHNRGESSIFTLVGLHRRRITIAFALERRGRPQIKGELGSFAWRDDANWDRWMLHAGGVMLGSDGALDLSELRAAAELAMTTVEGVPPPVKRSSAPVVAKSKATSRSARTRRKS